MHGRISRYSIATGAGVVTNYSKRIFELRKEHWHDRRLLPAAGMYVECRIDEKSGLIVDAHSSAYQDFSGDSLVKEIDFWKTDTDEELRTKEMDLRNQIAEEIFKKTNYLEMRQIDISTSIEDCLRQYFSAEANSISFALADLSDIPPEHQLNYLVVRRFLSKAMDYLVFCDKNITSDSFGLDLQKLNNLEYSYKTLLNAQGLKAESIYNDTFLEKQLHYRGAIKAILGIKEKVIQLKNKVKYCTMEIKKIRNQMELNKKDTTLPSKLETQKNIATKAEEEMKILVQCQGRLENITKTFKDSHFQQFSEIMRKVHLELLDKTKTALNMVCTALDNKMWKMGMASTSVHNSFFKQDINMPYCTMTFYGQYLKRLDKNKLADNEKSGYNYYHKYKKIHEKLFLIYSTNEKLQMYLKLQIMSASKEYCVVVVKTDGEFYTSLNAQVFESAYIDPFIRSNPKQLVIDAKNSKMNKGTRFIILSEQQAKSFASKQ